MKKMRVWVKSAIGLAMLVAALPGMMGGGCNVQQAIDDAISGELSVNAGADQTVCLGATVTLSASSAASSLTFSWQVVSSPVPVTVSDAAAQQTSFVPTTVGTYVLRVTVTTGDGTTATDDVTITVQVCDSGPGAIAGTVRDAVTNSALSGATVTLSDGASVVGTATSGSDGTFTFSELEPGESYQVEVALSGYVDETYYNIEVFSGQTTYLETVLQVAEEYSDDGSFSGTITHAVTGEPVGGLSIDFRAGINAQSGTVVASATTASDGTYTVSEVAGGSYTGEITGTGYITTYFTAVCIGGQDNPNQNATVNPVGTGGDDDGELRVVLTWGANPSDLDSHLTGPAADGSGDRFHIYHLNKTYTYDSVRQADLDVDDTSSYGPETTTIYVETAGTYRFSVHDFSNRFADSSTEMAESGAVVQVYIGDTLERTFNVPNTAGTLWTVFTYDGSTITPINTMSYESAPAAVTLPRGVTDAHLLQNLPEKD